MCRSADAEPANLTSSFFHSQQSSSTAAQGQEKLAQSEVFLLSCSANLAPLKDSIFFSPLKKIP